MTNKYEEALKLYREKDIAGKVCKFTEQVELIKCTYMQMYFYIDEITTNLKGLQSVIQESKNKEDKHTELEIDVKEHIICTLWDDGLEILKNSSKEELLVLGELGQSFKEDLKRFELISLEALEKQSDSEKRWDEMLNDDELRSLNALIEIEKDI